MSDAAVLERPPAAVPDVPDPLRVGVVVFPGSNCDRDAGNAWIENNLGEAVYLWHDSSDLQNVDAVFVPGGFSYGDALRAGAIARFAPLMEAVSQFAENGGIVMGICNGFQILCEAGLLPGALVRNESLRFTCKTVHLRVENAQTPFTSRCHGDVLAIPIAHGEGRYVCDEAAHAQLVRENRILFRYADAKGDLSPNANPNGSWDNIAGIVGGPHNNILGMMPHPERAASLRLGQTDGSRILESVADFLRSGKNKNGRAFPG